MPWKIEEREGEHCVIKQEDGSMEKCHPTRAAALRHMAALYVAEADTEDGQKRVTKTEADGQHPAGHYLVVEDPEHPSTWHLRVRGPDGEPDHRLMGAAWAALHQGYRGNRYEGPNKQEAIRKLRNLYEREGMDVPGEKRIPFYAVKFLDDTGQRVGGYAIRFGSPEEADLSLYRDFFVPSTDFWLDRWPARPMLYNHAQDPATGDKPVVGTWTKAAMDEIGVWLEGQLDEAHAYRSAIQELVAKGVLALSSDSAPHLIRRERQTNGTHRVTRWPLLAASLTPTPAEPRLLPVETIKSAYKAVGIDSFTIEEDASTGDGAKGVEETRRAAERRRQLELEIAILGLSTFVEGI